MQVKLGFGCNRDRVIVDFCGRKRDLLLSPDDGLRFAEKIEELCVVCESWMQSGGRGELVKGQDWNILVKSWDGFINIRFTVVGDECSLHERVSIPYEAARKMADHVRAKYTEARFRTHLEVGNLTATTAGD